MRRGLLASNILLPVIDGSLLWRPFWILSTRSSGALSGSEKCLEPLGAWRKWPICFANCCQNFSSRQCCSLVFSTATGFNCGVKKITQPASTKIFNILPSETLNCNLFSGILPVCPLKTHLYCPVDSSGSRSCISRAQLCDFTNDCWDGSDEMDCDNYTRCDFNDTGLCGWLQAKNDQMDWTRHKGSTASIYTGIKSR